jgi:hypothetical protein
MHIAYKRQERHGTYIGKNMNLSGARAIVLFYKNQPNCVAQFNNLKKFGGFHNSYALGWHEFKLSEFKFDEDIDWS